jgi:hypothetical protein
MSREAEELMPENETLRADPERARRWRPIAERLAKGASPIKLFPEIEDQFYKALHKVWKQWRDRGVDVSDLLRAAATDHQALQAQVIKLNNDANARFLSDVAVDVGNSSPEKFARKFLDAYWEDQVLNELDLVCHNEAQSPEFKELVEQMLNHIHLGLSRDLSRIPNRPPRKKSPTDLDNRLDESLL